MAASSRVHNTKCSNSNVESVHRMPISYIKHRNELRIKVQPRGQGKRRRECLFLDSMHRGIERNGRYTTKYVHSFTLLINVDRYIQKNVYSITTERTR